MFANLTIEKRLLAAFGLLLALMLAVAGAGGLGVQSARQSLVVVLGQVVPLHDQMSAGMRALLRARVAEQAMVANNLDNEAIGVHKKSWNAALTQASTELQAVRSSMSSQQHLQSVDVLNQRIEGYKVAFERYFKDLSGAKFPDAKEATGALGPVNEAFHAIELAAEENSKNVDEITRDVEASLGRSATVTGTVLGAILAIGLLIGMVVALGVSRSIIKPLAQAQTLAGHIAGGDLTHEVHVSGQDEAAQTLGSLQQMSVFLRRTVHDVRCGVDEIQLASGDVAAGSMDLSKRTEQAAFNLQHAASNVDMLAQNVQGSAESAMLADKLATTAAQVAQRGGDLVSEVVATMDAIQLSSRKISEIIGVIDGIAFQTNILALNAAVESARAGEQGRGFAVVAGEVRSLAQRSAEAAREIKTLINSSVDRVETGSQLVQRAGATMHEIVESAKRVCNTVGTISAAVAEQSSGIGEVSSALKELDHMTQANAALVEQSAAAAESLRSQANKLVTSVSLFRL